MQPVHVITSAAFHPNDGDLLAFSTSKTVLSIMDLRQKDIRGDRAVTFQEPVQVRSLSTVTLSSPAVKPVRATVHASRATHGALRCHSPGAALLGHHPKACPCCQPWPGRLRVSTTTQRAHAEWTVRAVRGAGRCT